MKNLVAAAVNNEDCAVGIRGSLLALKICAHIVLFLFTHFLGGSTFPKKFSHISFVFTGIIVEVFP
jgi:hypothetical protein